MNYEKKENKIKKISKDIIGSSFIVIIILTILIFILNKDFQNEIKKFKSEVKEYKIKVNYYKNELNKYKVKSEKDKKEELNKLVRYLQPKIDPTVCNTIVNSTYKYSQTYNIPPKLIISIMYRESTFNPYSVSSANCVGLMQINPKAHHDKIKDLKLTYPQLFFIDNNIKLGCMIFREYFDRYDHNIYTTLKRYVGGKHDTYSKDILSIFTESFIKSETPKKRK